jgi:hypothetical protein
MERGKSTITCASEGIVTTRNAELPEPTRKKERRREANQIFGLQRKHFFCCRRNCYFIQIETILRIKKTFLEQKSNKRLIYRPLLCETKFETNVIVVLVLRRTRG